MIEFVGETMRMPFREIEGGWKQREYSFAVDESKMPRTIDLLAKNTPHGRGIYEFTGDSKMCSSCHDHPYEVKGEKPVPLKRWGLCAPALKNSRAMRDADVRLALSIDGKRPTKFGGDGVIVFELKRFGTADPFTQPSAGPRVGLAHAGTANPSQGTRTHSEG